MPNVSLFSSISETKNPEDIDLTEYLENTRDGKWEDIVTKCRLILDHKERMEFKKTMPTVTLSGTFRERKDSELKEHSNYISIDLDHLDGLQVIKAKLEKDKYVFSVFMSTSGDGLRVLFHIDDQKHKESFEGISQYLFETYGVITDPNGSNPSKPYIVSFDPYLYMCFEEVPIFKKYIKHTPIKRVEDFVYTPGDFENIVQQITGRKINICESYNDWLKVGFAIASHFGEDGRYYFHEISRVSDKYKVRTTDDQYKYCLKAHGTNRANISTFYYLAKINGVNIASEQTRAIVRTTKNGKKAGLSKQQIIENLFKFSSISGADKIVADVFDTVQSEFEEEEESIITQLEMFISSHYSLKMNEVTGYLEQDDKRLSESDLNTIFIAAKKNMSKLDYPLMMRLLKSSFIETYNPFFKFFGSDGIAVELPAIPVEQSDYQSPIIDKLASTILNDNPAFTEFFLRKWVVSVVSSAHKVHSPLLLCLLGPQLTGKTEWLRRLPPKELNDYYAESKLDKEKDDELLMTENLWIMDDELGGKSKQDAQKLKNITSKQYFSLRRPYGDHNEKILRIATLCGTSNYNEVLTDPTGNRRIIPIEVKGTDKELYNSINKRDLWLEAFRLYKEGFDWRINYIDLSYLNKDEIKYETVVKEREILEKYFTNEDTVRLTSTEMVIELEKLTDQIISLSVLGRELDRLKYVRKTTRLPNGSTPKKWGVTRINRSPEGSPDSSMPF